MNIVNAITPPPITTYQQAALPLAVAMNNPTAYNWIYSNYIQVMCVNRRHYLSKGYEDNALHYGFLNPDNADIEPLEHISIEGKDPLYMFKDMNYIKQAVDNGWYVYTEADMFYIDESDSYGEWHYQHDMLIHGYDENNLYIYMYNKTKLTSRKVSFAHFIEGYCSEHCDYSEYKSRATLYKPNDLTCKVNLTKIRNHIHDYLNGTETFAREYPHIFHPDSLSLNGIRTYDEFSNLIEYALERGYKDLRKTDLYCLYEHKSVMKDRVVYLRENGYLKADDELIEAFDRIKHNANTIMLLGIKLALTPDDNGKNEILIRIRDKLVHMKAEEEKCWNRYIYINRGILG